MGKSPYSSSRPSPEARVTMLQPDLASLLLGSQRSPVTKMLRKAWLDPPRRPLTGGISQDAITGAKGITP